MTTRFLASSFVVLCALTPSLVAALSITEIEFNPDGNDTDREWIRLLNDGSESISFSTWRLVVNGKRHKVREAQAGSMVPVGASAVITNDIQTYRREHPQYDGYLFESSFAFPNDSAIISLVDADGKVVATKSYSAPPTEKKAQGAVSKKTKKVAAKGSPSQTMVSTDEEEVPGEGESTAQGTTSASQVAAAGRTTAIGGWWLLGASALGLLGAGTVVAARHSRKSEWDIVEITDDGV